MTPKQITAIKCAYLDLVGAMEAVVQQDVHAHDWDAHLDTIIELEECFDFLAKESNKKQE